MPSDKSMTVIIVGAGLGGLTTALALRQRGLRTVVLEQAAQLGEIGAGIQTAPNASRLLFNLGLRRELEAIKTEPQDHVRRRWDDGSIIAAKPLGAAVRRQYGAPYWHFHRADLHNVLLRACLDLSGTGPATEIHTSSGVQRIDDSDGSRPAAVTSDGRRFAGDVIVAADGIRSAVRDAMGFADTLEFTGEMCFRALIPTDKLAADPATRFLLDRYHATIWWGPDRHLVHFFIRNGDIFNIASCVPSTMDTDLAWTVPSTPEEMIEHLPGWDDRIGSIISKAEGEGGDAVTKWALFRRRRDPNWVDGHVALLGDAAHAMLPYQGQGASQAMEDAVVLAEELGGTSRSNIHEALLRYAARRATRAGMVQDASLENKTLYHLADGPEQAERDRNMHEFTGESHVSFDWLWRGPNVDDHDAESFDYPFGR
ncbi:FAD-dependent monooxygenase [Streptomyces fuscichromogenes]|uniref:Hydroxylase n=1 Tax=Streptomyces fuscichromogenes TaxID=1324013 RepID=A0A917XFQ2_9ACTN|nr:FAD-dependent monooxygenase [Streptomyces fuscichromogenes]GGN20283.1 hydroxylase [Streptomyces fuscichromogenes]